MVRTMFQGTVPLSVNHAVGAMVFILMVLNGAVRTQTTATVERTTLATTLSETLASGNSTTPMAITEGQTEQTGNGSTPTETTDGTSVSGTGSMTTAEQGGGTSHVESEIVCFTCNTTNMTDSCYGRQSANQSEFTKCNPGENCWTFRFDENDKFLNLTRACHPYPCSTMHNESEEATECFDMDISQHCTQCCKADLCNRHVNANTNESTTLATTLSETLASGNSTTPMAITEGQTEQTGNGSTPTETTDGTSVSETLASGNSTTPMAITEGQTEQTGNGSTPTETTDGTSVSVLNGAVRTQTTATVERTTLATTLSVTMPLPSTDGQTEQTVYGSTPTETTNGTSVSETSASDYTTIPMAPTEVDGTSVSVLNGAVRTQVATTVESTTLATTLSETSASDYTTIPMAPTEVDGTSVSGTGSMTTAEQGGGTLDVPVETSEIVCFTCTTRNMTDRCYGRQSANQSELTKCNAGENCWTFRFDENNKFLNLTRKCSKSSCSTIHNESEEAMDCSNTNIIQRCTQCCKADMCNRHVNDNANDEGNGLSGCLSGVVLSVVAVLGMIQQ